jgi:hypothetical protein
MGPPNAGGNRRLCLRHPGKGHPPMRTPILYRASNVFKKEVKSHSGLHRRLPEEKAVSGDRKIILVNF